MKVDNKNWRRYEALKHVLSHNSWEDIEHDYLSSPQMREILNDILNELKEKAKRERIVDHIRNK